ncbi:hypothetical protein U1Q18_004215, partial [Sarracenia purpurea var. burkii]
RRGLLCPNPHTGPPLLSLSATPATQAPRRCRPSSSGTPPSSPIRASTHRRSIDHHGARTAAPLRYLSSTLPIASTTKAID